ncbi:hypothetical protein PR048_026112 [Dryococelus australis]|uniref:Uncharacterized protein n=1 Tax=Dryococelus australis TaxID=614101 RepID=A0ABQ9GKE4_9NEOP|nr:hypothetical protein PR048_026112 [Dryococelus australis]
MSWLVCKIHAAEDALVNMDSEEENLLLVLLLRWRHRRRKQQRMSKNSFDDLLSLLKTHIGKADTNMRKSIPAEERLAITLREGLHKRWTHQSAEPQHGFLPLMMQVIASGTVVDYHQMMSGQMDTGRCTDEFEERRMGEIPHPSLQEVLCLCSDSGEMACVKL